MSSLLDGILKRPAMYCGKQFASIDEFSLFFHGLSLGLSINSNIPAADSAAITGFGRFMRHHLHGHDKNCRWEYDLLAKEGSHDYAIRAASVLMLHFRDMLRSEGVDRLEYVLQRANEFAAYLGDDHQFHVAAVDGDIESKA